MIDEKNCGKRVRDGTEEEEDQEKGATLRIQTLKFRIFAANV